MNALTLLAFLGVAAVSAVLLVLFNRQEELLRPDFDAEEAWLVDRSGASVGAVGLTALKHAALAAVFAVLTLALWRQFAPGFGWPSLPESAAALTRVLDSVDPPRQILALPSAFVQTPLLHLVAIGWLVLFYALTLWRCTERSLYDIFISYKSEDAPFARRIADALLATGWRVWFAEYQIVLNWRRWFRSIFMTGIAHSRFGLAITNDKWARSPHCVMEGRLLLLQLGPPKLIELRAPSEPMPHQHFSALARCPSLESRDINTIVRFLEGATRNPFPGAPLSEVQGSAAFAGAYDGRPCSIDVAGWSLFGAQDNTLTSAHWEYNDLPECALWGTLTIDPVDAGQLERGIRFGMDERRMFDVLTFWLRKRMAPLPPDLKNVPPNQADAARRVRESLKTKLWKHAKVRGVHMLFYDGRAQCGLTYWPGVRDTWRRLISLDVQNPATRAAASFTFAFTFHGTFRDYCRHAHLMDALALSLKWE